MMTIKDILILTMVKGLGPATIKKYIHRLKTDNNSYNLIKELKSEEVEHISVYEKRAEEIISSCHKEGIEIIHIASEDYPLSLLEISNPPTVLFLKGDKTILNKTIIAIIGTRHSTELGNRIAERLGEHFSQRYAICNGLVEGIDEHSIYVNKRTVPNVIGVISGGLCYKFTCSKSHIRIIEDVLKAGGLIISEYAPMKKEDQYSGSASSRIQAGLSSGIILVQSKIDGGSRYTLDKFAKLGRVIGVINFPANPEFQEDSFEANRLIIKEHEHGIARFIGLKTDKMLNVKAIIPIFCKDDYKFFEDELNKQSAQLDLF